MGINRACYILSFGLFMVSCGDQLQNNALEESPHHVKANDVILESATDVQFEHEDIYGINACRYEVPQDKWSNLSLKKKKLIYYLTQAGYAGRDLYAEQTFEYNLEVLELISIVHEGYRGDTSSKQWKSFDKYTKHAWINDGIFDCSSKKLSLPSFTKKWFKNQLALLDYDIRPEMEELLFPDSDEQAFGTINFYGADVSLDEAKDYYSNYVLLNGEHDSLEIGLNTKLIKNKKKELEERKYSTKGEGSECIKQMVYWLDKAAEVTESTEQKTSIRTLIEYYQTGDLALWERFNIEWLQVQDNEVDFLSGFVEKYDDPLSRKGSYESLVFIVDKEYSKKLKELSDKALWFEQNAPISDKHKKNYINATYAQVVNVISGSGSMTPTTFTEIGLPNSEWIRNRVGTKNIICKNILDMKMAFAAQGVLTEFANDEEEVLRHMAHSSEANVLAPSLRMLGYTFGKTEEGVASPMVTLRENSTTINYIIAYTFSMYYALDSRLIDFGFLSSNEVGKALSDKFLRSNYLISQGNFPIGQKSNNKEYIAQQAITYWLLENGEDSCLKTSNRNGKTYIDITDYNRFKELLGELLNKAITAEATGNYEDAVDLCAYGQNIHVELATEIHERKSTLELPGQSAVIQPLLETVHDDQGEIMDVKIIYDTPISERMLQLREEFGFMRKQKGPMKKSNSPS